MAKLERKGEKSHKPVNFSLGGECLEKLRKLAKLNNASQTSIIRYLIDLAIEGKIKFN